MDNFIEKGNNKTLISEIRQLKQSLNDLKTPKLYQKIISQYKNKCKNRKVAKIFENENSGNFKCKKYSYDQNNQNLSLLQQVENSDQEVSTFSQQISTFSKTNREVYNKNKFEEKFVQTDCYNLEINNNEEKEKTIEILEKDVNTLRIQNIKLEKALKISKENLAALGRVKKIKNIQKSFIFYK